MTTTDLSKFLQKHEFGGATGRPRHVTFSVNGCFISDPVVYVCSTDDGLYTGICIGIDGEEKMVDEDYANHKSGE